MNLTVFEDGIGLWSRDGVEDGTVPFNRSSVDISVTDGRGNELDGALRVNGTPFEIKRGKCKIRTEAFRKVGFSDVELVSESGVKRSCAYVYGTVENAWYFPLPREAMTNDDILSLLRKLERMREKLESAKALCTDTVSDVLGI